MENTEIKINISMPLQVVNVILAGLGKLPLEVSGDIFSSLKAEAEKQLKAANTEDVPE